MINEKRCLKFTGYLYLPLDDSYKILRKNVARTYGRIEVYDEFNKKKQSKMIAFDNVGKMVDIILKEYTKRTLKKLPKPKEKSKVKF